MAYFYYFMMLSVLSIGIYLTLSFLFRNKNTAADLFAEALRNENQGYFEAALITYENALNEEKKTRFSNKHLKNRITDKLKVLRTMIEYKNNLSIIRK